MFLFCRESGKTDNIGKLILVMLTIDTEQPSKGNKTYEHLVVNTNQNNCCHRLTQ